MATDGRMGIMSDDPVLSRLHQLARWLSDPSRDCSILAEGNVSAAIPGGESFWLKASGCQMGTMRPDQFVKMDIGRTLELLAHERLADPEIQRLLLAGRSNPDDTLQPSVEAALHAICIVEGGCQVVGHTHPTAWLSVLCSENARAAVAGRLFPDEIVVCGPAPAFVPYVDPGPPLARAVRDAILAHKDAWGEGPKVILMQNHGLVALGKDADEVERITAMSVKVARALIGTYSMGGPRFLSDADVNRIHKRPDEHLRRQALDAGKSA